MNVMHFALYSAPVLVMAVVTSVVSITLRLKNPAQTETQLFLRYWKLWTTLIVLDLAAVAVMAIYVFTHLPRG
jgi:hypothetical protein